MGVALAPVYFCLADREFGLGIGTMAAWLEGPVLMLLEVLLFLANSILQV